MNMIKAVEKFLFLSEYKGYGTFKNYLKEKYDMDLNDEIWSYFRMNPEHTGLPFEINVPDNGTHKDFNHPMWLYINVEGTREKIPVTICDDPQVVGYDIPVEDYYKVRTFIINNLKLLQKIGNGGWEDHGKVFKTVKKIYETTCKLPELLLENPIISSKETGIGTRIWVDDKEDYKGGGHWKRMKFSADGSRNSYNFSSVTISDNPEIIHTGKTELSPTVIARLKEFVKVNKNELLKLSDKQITTEQFKSTMIRFDRNGKLVYPKPPYEKIGNNTLGFTKIKLKNGKYNFLNNNNTIAFPKYSFDTVNDFGKYGNNVHSMVVLNSKWFYLYPNGDLKPVQEG